MPKGDCYRANGRLAISHMKDSNWKLCHGVGILQTDGKPFGHAWVEVQENGRWFAVEPTMGPYYDEDLGIVVDSVPVNYDYFKYHTYPAEEIWFYYNNEYFLDISDMRGNAPPSWRQSAASWLEEDLTGFEGRR